MSDERYEPTPVGLQVVLDTAALMRSLDPSPMSRLLDPQHEWPAYRKPTGYEPCEECGAGPGLKARLCERLGHPILRRRKQWPRCWCRFRAG